MMPLSRRGGSSASPPSPPPFDVAVVGGGVVGCGVARALALAGLGSNARTVLLERESVVAGSWASAGNTGIAATAADCDARATPLERKLLGRGLWLWLLGRLAEAARDGFPVHHERRAVPLRASDRSRLPVPSRRQRRRLDLWDWLERQRRRHRLQRQRRRLWRGHVCTAPHGRDAARR